MVPHCYYITASYFLDKHYSEIGHRTQRNLKILSSKKGLALAEELEDAVRKQIGGFSAIGVELFNLSIDHVFDCGEEESEVVPYMQA